MRYRSRKTQERENQARPFRKQMVAAVGKCEICATSPQKPKHPIEELNRLCCHEIANGPDRLKALDKPYAILVLCWSCNGNKVTDKSVWPEARQLALLKARRPKDFDLVAYNFLVNPRAPRRIEPHEIAEFSFSD